jgi:guanylate kinase
MKPGQPRNKKRTGLMIVLSSPSGGGKTTIARRLLKNDKNIIRSISCTTRKPRRGEKNGRDYFFTSPTQFKSMAARKDFLEWARVHGQLYGTPRHWVEKQMNEGKDVLFVIDVQGGRAIKSKNPAALLIFLKPPSFKVLKERLEGRQSEDPSGLKIRLENARKEMREGRRYDYRVLNDSLNKAVSDVAKIIKNARQKCINLNVVKAAK